MSSRINSLESQSLRERSARLSPLLPVNKTDMDEKEDVEMQVLISPEVLDVEPTPPKFLERARLGNLDLFREELANDNRPLDFKAGRDVHFNRTPLHLAAMEGHDTIVEFILSHPQISREVVNAKDCFGLTPLHLAVRHSHESVVRLLTTSSWVLPDRFLTATSDPDDLGMDCGGCTPLHLAAERGLGHIARLLLQQSCELEFAYDPVNVFALNWDGKTPLDLARQGKFENLVVVLEGSNVNWLQHELGRNSVSVNAILVGAALVVAATFACWMQPPGGIPTPDSEAAATGAPSLSPAASPPSSSWNSDRGLSSRFYFCVAIAFSFSVMSLLLGTYATFPFPRASLGADLRVLRWTLQRARGLLLVSLYFLILAFTSAGFIVFDKVAPTQGPIYKLIHLIVNVLPSASAGFIIGYCLFWK